MKSSLQAPKPLPKSRSRTTSPASDLSFSSIPRLPKIKEQSPDTGFLAASHHSLPDLPDPVTISAQSASSDITEEPKLLSNAECLAGPDHVLPDPPHSSAQRQLLLISKVHEEHLSKGKSDEVISASDMIKKALDEINQSNDISNNTKKIMDAMFDTAVQQLNGMDSERRAVRLADPDLMIRLRIIILLLVILILVVRLVFKLCVADAHDWAYGFTPT